MNKLKHSKTTQNNYNIIVIMYYTMNVQIFNCIYEHENTNNKKGQEFVLNLTPKDVFEV